MGAIFVLIASFRGNEIGLDTANYIRDYDITPELGMLHEDYLESTRYQPLWVYFVCVIKTLFGSFEWVKIFQSLFINFILLRYFYKYTQFPFICITIYFIAFYLEFNTEIMRESIAVCFCLLSYEYLRKKRYLFSIIFWICAYNFHFSALIALTIPFLSKIKYSGKSLMIVSFAGSLLLIIFPFISKYSIAIELLVANISPYLADRITEYNSTELDNTLNVFYYISLFTTYLVIPILFLMVLKERINQYYGFIVAFILLQILSSFSYGFYRFANYFFPFYAIFLSEFIYTVSYKYIKQIGARILIFLIFIISILFLSQRKLLVKDSNPESNVEYIYGRYIPYKTIFEQ